MFTISPRLTGLFRRVSLLLAAIAMLPASAALAVESGPYSMEVLVDGVPLQEYVARGTTYVRALEGREYSIRLRNHTSRRIAVALAVDGLNSIDARRTAAGSAAKWILAPHGTITIDGWQTGEGHARRFFFTSEQASYGAWLGETKNLGLVSAAVFREKVRRPAPIQKPRTGRSRSRGEAPAPGIGSTGSAGKSTERARRESSGEAEGSVLSEAAPKDDLAATGIGRRVDHRVVRVQFEAERAPAATLDVRYEYHDALVRLGVLPTPAGECCEPLSRRERARGFSSGDFAPDPFSCCNW